MLYGGRTRGISESVAVYLVTSALVLAAGALWGGVTGLYVAMVAMVLSFATQDAWLWWRSRPVFETLKTREQAALA
jgi:hypothetical protein